MEIVCKKQNIKKNYYGDTVDIDIDGIDMDKTFKVKKIISNSHYIHNGPTLADLKNSKLSGSSFNNTNMNYKIHKV